MAFMPSRFLEWLQKAMSVRGGGGIDYRWADLARDLHIRPNTITEWKKGKPPSRDNIHKLAIHFGVTSRFIYGLLDKKPPKDLNDTYEQVAAIVYRMTHSRQSELLKELESRNGTPAETDKKETANNRRTHGH